MTRSSSIGPRGILVPKIPSPQLGLVSFSLKVEVQEDFSDVLG